MKHREAPKPIPAKLHRQNLANDPQVREWIRRLQGDPDAKLHQIGEQQLTFVVEEVLKRRKQEFSPTAFEKAMRQTCPVLSAPESKDPLADLEPMFAQPEMQELWSEWKLPRPARGPAPASGDAKALAAILGMTGESPHIDDAYGILKKMPSVRQTFEQLERATSSEPRKTAPFLLGDTPIQSYSTYTRLLKRLALDGDATKLIKQTNIKMIKALAVLFPGAGIGENLLLDGSAFPSWSPQRGAGPRRLHNGQANPNWEIGEERLRKFSPDSGFRAYMYDSDGKRDVAPDDRAADVMRRGRGKAWRGWFLVVIFEQKTGLPLVWNVTDAAHDEADNLIPLLSDLYALWPECPAKYIAGDSAWDEDRWCRLAEVNYGIHPVFRQGGRSRARMLKSGESQSGSVVAIGEHGELHCQHGHKLSFSTAETPGRTDLTPGKAHPQEGAFRVRAEGCPKCGKPGLQMSAQWARLTFVPHFSSGNPNGHAFRLALLARLSQAESFFQRLKSGRKIATVGTDRARVRDRRVAEMLVSLACISYTALTLADQREQAGQKMPWPPENDDPEVLEMSPRLAASKAEAPSREGRGVRPPVAAAATRRMRVSYTFTKAA
jgi:hypothetical protein